MAGSTVSMDVTYYTDSDDNATTANIVQNGTFGHISTDHYRYDDGYYYYDYSWYYLEIFKFETYTMGFVQPILIILTALTNIYVIGYFLTRKNSGKAINLLFGSIAFSDTMTGVTLLPISFGVYATNNVDLTWNWCNGYMILRLYVSPVFHTVSVWQTVTLCIQRYICVCHPFISGRICTFWKTFTSIIVMYVCAVVLHVYHLVDNKHIQVQCIWEPEIPCEELCVYLWFCLALQHLLPCFLLVCLTSVTIKELRQTQKRVSNSITRNARRSSRSKTFTNTAALIVLFFLIPELPHGMYRLVFLIYMHMGNYDTITPEENHIIICVYELALTISFSANFWIYCCMMRDFRYRVYKIISCGVFKRGLGRLRSLSQSSRDEGVRTTLSRSSSNVSRNRVFSRTTSVHSTTSENVHAVIPLTPTRGYDQINHTGTTEAGHQDDDDTNDDVFV